MLKKLLTVCAAVALMSSPALADKASDSMNTKAMKSSATAATSAATKAAEGAMQEMKMNMAQRLKQSGQFSTLTTMLQTADMMDTMMSSEPMTLFAPTDAAFAKLSPQMTKDLMDPQNREKLRSILSYHVVPGKVMAASLAGKQMQPQTAQGNAIEIDATSGTVMLNGNAKVIGADMVASNGVIHVIDSVLMPDQATTAKY